MPKLLTYKKLENLKVFYLGTGNLHREVPLLIFTSYAKTLAFSFYMTRKNKGILKKRKHKRELLP